MASRDGWGASGVWIGEGRGGGRGGGRSAGEQAGVGGGAELRGGAGMQWLLEGDGVLQEVGPGGVGGGGIRREQGTGDEGYVPR
jgi:hypothetical protein